MTYALNEVAVVWIESLDSILLVRNDTSNSPEIWVFGEKGFIGAIPPDSHYKMMPLAEERKLTLTTFGATADKRKSQQIQLRNELDGLKRMKKCTGVEIPFFYPSKENKRNIAYISKPIFRNNRRNVPVTIHVHFLDANKGEPPFFIAVDNRHNSDVSIAAYCVHPQELALGEDRWRKLQFNVLPVNTSDSKMNAVQSSPASGKKNPLRQAVGGMKKKVQALSALNASRVTQTVVANKGVTKAWMDLPNSEDSDVSLEAMQVVFFEVSPDIRFEIILNTKSLKTEKYDDSSEFQLIDSESLTPVDEVHTGIIFGVRILMSQACPVHEDSAFAARLKDVANETVNYMPSESDYYDDEEELSLPGFINEVIEEDYKRTLKAVGNSRLGVKSEQLLNNFQLADIVDYYPNCLKTLHGSSKTINIVSQAYKIAGKEVSAEPSDFFRSYAQCLAAIQLAQRNGESSAKSFLQFNLKAGQEPLVSDCVKAESLYEIGSKLPVLSSPSKDQLASNWETLNDILRGQKEGNPKTALADFIKKIDSDIWQAIHEGCLKNGECINYVSDTGSGSYREQVSKWVQKYKTASWKGWNSLPDNIQATLDQTIDSLRGLGFPELHLLGSILIANQVYDFVRNTSEEELKKAIFNRNIILNQLKLEKPVKPTDLSLVLEAVVNNSIQNTLPFSSENEKLESSNGHFELDPNLGLGSPSSETVSEIVKETPKEVVEQLQAEPNLPPVPVSGFHFEIDDPKPVDMIASTVVDDLETQGAELVDQKHNSETLTNDSEIMEKFTCKEDLQILREPESSMFRELCGNVSGMPYRYLFSVIDEINEQEHPGVKGRLRELRKVVIQWAREGAVFDLKGRAAVEQFNRSISTQVKDDLEMHFCMKVEKIKAALSSKDAEDFPSEIDDWDHGHLQEAEILIEGNE